MKTLKNKFLFLAIIAIAIAGFGISNEALAQGGKATKVKTKMDTPSIVAVGMTGASIDIQVTAGATGAPAGFSLQWMTAAEYALGPDGLPGTADDNTWYASDDIRLCKASFSGNANNSNYNLGAGQSVIVRVGDFLFDNGASTNCAEPLICNTNYVFRAFAHASSTLQRSDFTANVFKMTLPCGDPIAGCTYTQGYWKTHGPIPTGNNTNTWQPAGTYGSVVLFELGFPGTAYSSDGLGWQSIFDTPPSGGNGLISLSHQLMAAKLNVANGADPTAVSAAITAADAMVGSLVVPPVGGGFLSAATTSGLTTTLDNYNSGLTGPGHCP